MDILTTLHTSSHAIERSERISQIAENDPHGIIISLTSISIVFLSLILLYLAYELIGMIVNRWLLKNKDCRFVAEDNITVSGHDIHDEESYAITIVRKGGPVQKTVDRGIRLSPNVSSDEEAQSQQNRTTVAAADGIVRSPLPGTILKISVKEGDKVEIGQAVALLEAMKMENTIEAERNGTVTQIHVLQGDSVLEGSEIITIE